MKKTVVLIGLAAALCVPARAAVFSANYNVNAAIPDNNILGLTDSHVVSGINGQISDISVTLNITGGFNGDLYGYLRLNDSPMVVLVNRVGMTASNPDGYDNTGFQVTLSTALGAHDIHYYQDYSPSYNGSGQLTGEWQADGRSDPLGYSRGSLTQFDGLNPNGTWTLFFADMSATEESRLVGWSLNLTVIPEPVNVALGLLGLLFFVGGVCRTDLVRGIFHKAPLRSL
jgi:subtilisin-like proprotein convertase family protein